MDKKKEKSLFRVDLTDWLKASMILSFPFFLFLFLNRETKGNQTARRKRENKEERGMLGLIQERDWKKGLSFDHLNHKRPSLSMHHMTATAAE